MIAKLETLQLDPSDSVVVWTAGDCDARVHLEAHTDESIWVSIRNPSTSELFETSYLIPKAGQRLELVLGPGQVLTAICDPAIGVTSVVSVAVEVPNA